MIRRTVWTLGTKRWKMKGHVFSIRCTVLVYYSTLQAYTTSSYLWCQRCAKYPLTHYASPQTIVSLFQKCALNRNSAKSSSISYLSDPNLSGKKKKAPTIEIITSRTNAEHQVIVNYYYTLCNTQTKRHFLLDVNHKLCRIRTLHFYPYVAHECILLFLSSLIS